MKNKKQAKEKLKKIDYVPKRNRLIEVKDKKTAGLFAYIILEMARTGYTMNMILYEFDIRKSEFDKMYKKYKVIRNAVSDAIGFRKGYGEAELMKMALGKKTHSQQLAKLYMESFYDIKEAKQGVEKETPEETGKLARAKYIVKPTIRTTTTKKEIIEE